MKKFESKLSKLPLLAQQVRHERGKQGIYGRYRKMALLCIVLLLCGFAGCSKETGTTAPTEAINPTTAEKPTEALEEETKAPEPTAATEPTTAPEDTHYQTISMAKGSQMEIEMERKTLKSCESSDPSVVSVFSGTMKIKAEKEGTATITFTTVDKKTYTDTILVFDQESLLNPDYTGINRENYMEKLNAQKAKVNQVLQCDKIVFFMDYFHAAYVDFSCPHDLNANLIDLTKGELDIYVNFNSCPAEYHLLGLLTNWEDCNNYVDLNRHTKEFATSPNAQIRKMSLTEEEADAVRSVGLLKLSGYGYQINSVTIVGTPVKEYPYITASADSPVAKYGQLYVDGAIVKGEDKQPVRILGVQPAWSASAGILYGNSKTYNYLNKEWGISAIRIVQTVSEEDGYAAPEMSCKEEKLYFNQVMVNACIESGMYAVLDWHAYKNPLTYADEAEEYFDILSKKYANVPNVIYEICNEPCDDDDTPEVEDSWENIKKYADRIIAVIRNNSPDAIIICGTPFYSNLLGYATEDPLPYENVMYTNHVYEWGFSNLKYEQDAVAHGLTIAVTETYISYNDMVITEEERKSYEELEKLWREYYVATFVHGFWYGDGKLLLKKDSTQRYGWTEEDYTVTGLYMYHFMRRAAGLE